MRFKLFGRCTSEHIAGENEASVSSQGEVIVREFDYSDFNTQFLDTINTASNHFKPKDGFRFVIKGISISGNRNIGVNGSIYSLYTANSATSTTIIDEPFTAEIPKSSVLVAILPAIRIAEGVFLNSKCDDDDIRVTIYGYYVPA